MVDYFNRKMVGGMINSIGITEQDCASITYMFRYLDSELKYITFRHMMILLLNLEMGRGYMYR